MSERSPWFAPEAAPGQGETRSEPIRVGIIGAGFGASLHLDALAALPEARVAAICARHADRAFVMAVDHQIPEHTTDFHQLVRMPEIDAVIVAPPPHLHHQMTIAALEAGKHVLCEKPMARNLAEARDMVRIADRVGVVAMVNHQLRFLPIRARIKELLDEGFIGEVQAASIVVHRSSLNDPLGRPYGWLSDQEKAGGMLGAVGSHYLDALRWWCGDVKAVAGATATLVKQRRMPDAATMAKVDADDNFAVVIRFGNGSLGTIHVTATAGYEGDEEITISGLRGTLLVRDGSLWAARGGDGAPRELSIPERL
ncbi:MAG TPA: Gfo/Idh/MocA family oxidoreductase, partial [Thermomicrobiales bacterium]|nr:Gfo/Idh/MocA family oxidoreductase [Thermomicrobiales bacterium]